MSTSGARRGYREFIRMAQGSSLEDDRDSPEIVRGSRKACWEICWELAEGIRGLPGVRWKLADGIESLLGVCQELVKGDWERAKMASEISPKEDQETRRKIVGGS
ncbi:hypothetical protein B296_00035511 [Ensete ventricosum]|uniref:Uncharacterized protein n=1 Tax=Ensete ventricosum TaxID=4639 RepID=A0A426X4P3_ENSVE|nr:hypothetical protein B296_00035511 [Ensete ventricosum]